MLDVRYRVVAEASVNINLDLEKNQSIENANNYNRRIKALPKGLPPLFTGTSPLYCLSD